MKSFDTIAIEGYDIVATAQVVEGGTPYDEAIVLNNNSNVYIVAMRSEGSPTHVSVRQILHYDTTNRSLLNAYRNALRDMVNRALTH